MENYSSELKQKSEEPVVSPNPQLVSEPPEEPAQSPQEPASPIEPPAKEESHSSALHFFLYLVSFLSLCFVSTGAGAILFQLINKNFDTITRYDYLGYFSQYAIKYGIAALIIATPVYFILMFLISKYIREGRIEETSKVRKWLTYIVLFLTSATILGDLISLVYNMLGGDIVARFILKVVVVLVIAGAVFSYYLIDMRRKNMAGQSYMINKVFAGASLLAILITVVLGFTIIDSPFASRDKKIDSQTVSDVRRIDSDVKNYYRKNNLLPSDINDLQSSSYRSPSEVDMRVSYEKVSETDYKLCAEFKRSSSDYKKDQSSYVSRTMEEWKHEKGNFCFDRDIRDVNISNRTSSTPSRTTQGGTPINATITHIKEYMRGAVTIATVCHDSGAVVTSGNGGDVICPGKFEMKWPVVGNCGRNPEDTRWIVKNEDSENWDFTISCKGLPQCNGPENAICNANGCTFSGTCK